MMRQLRWFLAALGCFIIGTIGYYGYSFYQFGQHIQKKDNNSLFQSLSNPDAFQPKSPTPGWKLQNMTAETYTPPKWEGTEPVNVLLLGGDSRGLAPAEVPRSDTILVAAMDPVAKKATLFSLMRDTYVDIPGHGKERINVALQLGGPELTMQTVGEMLGLPIQYYAYTDFKGFIALVDAVGGIDISVEKDMKYRDAADGPEYDIDLKKGYQHLDGKTALQYVRFRHDALSDFSRTDRQRKFMKALAVELKSASSLLKLPKILSSIDPYIETNMTITEMLKLGALGFDLQTESMETLQLPPSKLLKERKIRGAAVLTADPEELRSYVRDRLAGAPEQDAAADAPGVDVPAGGDEGALDPGGASSPGFDAGVGADEPATEREAVDAMGASGEGLVLPDKPAASGVGADEPTAEQAARGRGPLEAGVTGELGARLEITSPEPEPARIWEHAGRPRSPQGRSQ